MRAALQGYRDISSPERASFWVLSSFASTIAVARTINYVRERQRALPRARAWRRRIYNAPRSGGARVHHFVPGIALAFAAGGAAVVGRTDGLEPLFGVPFGVGAGMTADEIALLVDVDNPYWRSERLAMYQAIAAGLGACAVAARVGWRTRES
ncbi:MAG: hypothetical protein M3340_00850 [Actinomycetota bacterium]|nr:hypothetical protein [Actinomycetota bacterium]